jgi:hypothetical protein
MYVPCGYAEFSNMQEFSGPAELNGIHELYGYAELSDMQWWICRA